MCKGRWNDTTSLSEVVVHRGKQNDLVFFQLTKSSFNGGYLRSGFASGKIVGEESIDPSQTYRSYIDNFSVRVAVGPRAISQGKRASLCKAMRGLMGHLSHEGGRLIGKCALAYMQEKCGAKWS